MPSECAEAEAAEIGTSGENDQRGACSLQGPARVAQVSGDQDTRAQREKTEREPTEELPTMRAVVDSAPRCRGPSHVHRGTACDRLDHETLATGTGPTTVKERSPGCPVVLARPAIVERAPAGIPAISACSRCSACSRSRRSDGRRTGTCAAPCGLEQPLPESEPDHHRSDTGRPHGEFWDRESLCWSARGRQVGRSDHRVGAIADR